MAGERHGRPKAPPHIPREVPATSSSPAHLKITEPIVFVIDDDSSMREALKSLIASDAALRSRLGDQKVVALKSPKMVPRARLAGEPGA